MKEVMKHVSEARPNLVLDAALQIIDKHHLDVYQRARDMVLDGGFRIQKTQDPSHDVYHYVHMLWDTDRLLIQYPELRDRIDWNIYLCALSFHDDAVSSLSPNPINMFIAQKAETYIASKPVVRYMREYGFPKNEIKNVSDIVRLHPLDPNSSKRIAWEQSVDEKLRLTSRLFYVIDSLDVFRPSRIDAMLRYIQLSLRNVSITSWYRQLHRYYSDNTKFSFSLGSEYPGISELADRRRRGAIAHIDELVRTRRAVVSV